jgi:DNA-binding MarR family transcriptional regulator
LSVLFLRIYPCFWFMVAGQPIFDRSVAERIGSRKDAMNTQGELVRLEDYMEKIFLALRYITHISSLYSKLLAKERNLTTGQLLCLRALAKEDNLPIRQISKRIFLSPSTVTGVIDRLEARGLIARRRDNPDRRIISLVITDEGRRLVESAPVPIQSLLAENLKKLPLQEVQGICSGLERVLDFIKAAGVVEEKPEPDLDLKAF